MKRRYRLSLLAAVGLIVAAHLGGVFALKLYRSAQSLDSLQAQLTRAQASALQVKQVRENRQSQVQALIRAGRRHPRMPAERLRAQLDQMVTSLSGAVLQNQIPEREVTAAQESDAGVLIIGYRAVIHCDAAQMTTLLAGLAQARPGMLVTGLAIEPGVGASPGVLKLTLEGVALLEP